jgi:hypothetical protein
MSEMVDRVAAALTDQMVKDQDETSAFYGDDHDGKYMKRLARAAISAMREPTEEMYRTRPLTDDPPRHDQQGPGGSVMDPLIKAVFDKLPTWQSPPRAPLPDGAKIKFPNRDEWTAALNTALDLVYEYIPDCDALPSRVLTEEGRKLMEGK